MAKRDHHADDTLPAKWAEANPHLGGDPGIVQLSAVPARAAEDSAAAIARQLNGPLTALMLYMNELKQQSHQFSQTPGNRIYLQQVVENALQQTERVYALVKQLADGPAGSTEVAQRKSECARRSGPGACPDSCVKIPNRRSTVAARAFPVQA